LAIDLSAQILSTNKIYLEIHRASSVAY
jgi:hypothetical protein